MRIIPALFALPLLAPLAAAPAAPPVSPDMKPGRPATAANGRSPERLFNGIELPDVWPPRSRDPRSVEPMEVPYLRRPPQVVPIDVGRQLFVDDFLIQETTLTRTFHRPEKFAGNPVFRAETPRELAGAVEGRTPQKATVYPGHGGLFYDPRDGVFTLFYTAGWRGPLAVATSPDSVRWTRPALGLAGDNVLLPAGRRWTGPELASSGSDNCVWLDVAARDPAERIRFLTCWMHVPKRERPAGFSHSLHVSDGRTWSKGRPAGMAEDYCSFFFNPFRNVWAFSIKQGGPRGRCRHYSENEDFLAGADWSKAVYWTSADRLDPPEPAGGYPGAGEPTQLYSLDAVAYESLMLGMHMILRGPRNEICEEGGFPKLTDLHLGFSRDGFHWDRPDRRPFIAAARTDGTWDRAYVHPITGLVVVLDDRLVFPYCGFSGIAPDGSRGMYTGGGVGIATLRRDGFASVDGPGGLTTRPLVFTGRHLFVNFRGRLRAEVLDESGTVLAVSKEAAGDGTRDRLAWTGTGGRHDLADLAGRPVRLRFTLPEGSLYAFWVTPDAGGASNGYVGAGGPAYGGAADSSLK